MRDGERKRRRHSGVNGVPTLREDGGAGVARRRGHAHDQAVLRRDAKVRLRARARRCGENERDKEQETCAHDVEEPDDYRLSDAGVVVFFSAPRLYLSNQ